ncbi:nucleoside hydrolase [Fictibacillus sp. 23RED33]|uniref:nucleoside hydrolase n=1 Tax=Fictibacillus sp. 23RED33 TaxID=2745879 RepID=UPI0018CD775D|nr:nucleoside hydrolase [Fictibacillus sp. 23RED33]MBH0175717.1 nucleoside hydrolase [Fictibacillus sp. 23RED33]
MKKKILFFCDPGIDDSLAIIYTLLHPNLELVGIVTSYGNVTKEQATANAYYLLKLANQEHIPIIPGAANPVQQDPVTYYPEIHGAGGIGPIQPQSDMKYQIYPFDTIRYLFNKYGKELIVVDTGRSTSLAIAFILYNQEITNVGAFYIMGGAFFVPGNVTPLAEANFYGDPTSSNYVLKYAHNLTIVPLNATQDAILTEQIIQHVIQQTTSPFRDLLKPIFLYYYKAYQKLIPGIHGAPIHDLLAIMLINNPSIVNYIFYDAKVINGTGEAKGLSYIDLRPTGQNGKTRIATKLNYSLFIEDFIDVMVNTER